MTKTRRSKKSIKAIVKSVIDRKSETKSHSNVSGAFDYVGVSSAGTLIPLTAGIIQGTADFQRIGNQISLKKLLVSKVIRAVQSQHSYSNAVRVLLVQSRGGPLTVADMPNYWSPCNLNKMIVVRDMMFNVGTSGSDYSSGYTGPAGTKRLQIRLNRFPYRTLQYNGSSGDAARPLYLYLQAESSNTVEQAGFETVYYKDM